MFLNFATDPFDLSAADSFGTYPQIGGSSDGSPGNYLGGAETKAAMLRMEAVA